MLTLEKRLEIAQELRAIKHFGPMAWPQLIDAIIEIVEEVPVTLDDFDMEDLVRERTFEEEDND
jgi:hypothetical protein